MFWRGRFNSIMTLMFFLGVVTGVVGILASLKVFPMIPQSWDEPLILSAVLLIVLSLCIRVIANLLNMIMTAFGKPLFYDIQVRD